MAAIPGGDDGWGTGPLEPVGLRWGGGPTTAGPLTVRNWRNCNASLTLVAEINALFPGRDKKSDGTIGDAAHAARTSDHNPWVIVKGIGVVRARDIDKDGIPLAQIFEYLRKLGERKDPRLFPNGYLIYNEAITNPDFKSWRKYTGSNPHKEHGHVSFSTVESGFDSTAPWGIANNGNSNIVVDGGEMQKDERDALFRTQALCESIFAQMAGPGTNIGDKVFKGWPAWQGGTGESLTMVDYHRRTNTMVADALRRLDAISKGGVQNASRDDITSAVREAMSQDNTVLADMVVDRLVARLANG